MEPQRPEITISDVVVSTAGRDQGEWFYVVATQAEFLLLANGRERTLEKPKRKKCKHVEKVLRADTRVAEKLRSGDKVQNSELRRDLAYLRQKMQSNDRGGF